MEFTFRTGPLLVCFLSSVIVVVCSDAQTKIYIASGGATVPFDVYKVVLTVL